MLSHRHMGAPLSNFLSRVEWKCCYYIMVDDDIHLRLLATSILDIYKVFDVLVCCLIGTWMHPHVITEDGWPQILEFWVTCGVKLIQLCDCWGWHPTQTASHIHIRHTESVWGIGMLSQGHMDAFLYHSTSQVGHRFLEFLDICGVEMMQFHHGSGWHPPQTVSHIHITHI